MTPDQRAAIVARLAAATPGPWHSLPDSAMPNRGQIMSGDLGMNVNVATTWWENNPWHDADFIAHAPTDIAALLADNAALREALAGLVTAWDAYEQAKDSNALVAAVNGIAPALTAARRLVEK